MEKIRYSEISVNQLDEYDNIPFYYETTKKYNLIKINNGLGEIKMELVNVTTFH